MNQPKHEQTRLRELMNNHFINAPNFTQAIGTVSFLKAGPMSMVQDQGRRRCQHMGFASSGACDLYAYHWANKLLGNRLDAATFEITLGPVQMVFSTPTRISITGATNQALLNGQKILPWSSVRIDKDDTLTIPMPLQGLRTYIAIQGGLQQPKLFGSQSQTIREFLPKPFGGPIKQNDLFTYQTIDQDTFSQRNLMAPHRYLPDYQKELVVTIRPCYQFKKFSSKAIKTILGNSYEISPFSDRMGYQLKGEALEFPGAIDWSEGIAMGSIQVPESGLPIILLRDRQTIGGYPKIGTLSEEDCSALTQRRPGQRIRFALQE